MGPTRMNEAIHNYLRISSGATSERMWNELSRFRRLGIPYEDVPKTEAEFTSGLNSLLAAGLAEKTSNGMWLWVPAAHPAQPQPAKRPRQESLFA